MNIFVRLLIEGERHVKKLTHFTKDLNFPFQQMEEVPVIRGKMSIWLFLSCSLLQKAVLSIDNLPGIFILHKFCPLFSQKKTQPHLYGMVNITLPSQTSVM